MEQDIVGAEDHVLYHHVLVSLEHGIWRQVRRIDLHHLLPVEGNPVRFAVFRPGLRLTPFLFRVVVLGRRLRRVGLDRRRALLAFEPVELVAQALVLCLSRPEVGHDTFQHVQQPLDQLACPFIGNAGQVKVFKHSASGSRRGKGAYRDLLCPLSFVVATRQGRGFQPRIFEVIREKGPVEIEMVKRRVQTRVERKRTGPEEWLVVTRRPLTDDRTLEPRASRDVTDQDARYRYHYYLTPTDGGEVAFKEPSLGELGRVIKAGACSEASFKRGKGEVGMDEYQVRTWQGWHHHMALSLMAVWFLIGETHRGQQVTPAFTLPQVRYGLSQLLLEVCCTPGVDDICRQVQRQLLRNELARFYHHRTRKCIPPRKLRREIQWVYARAVYRIR